MSDITRPGGNDDAEEQAIRTFHKHKRAAIEAVEIADALKQENAALKARADLIEEQDRELRAENARLRARLEDAFNVVAFTGKSILELSDRLRDGPPAQQTNGAAAETDKAAETLSTLARSLGVSGGDDDGKPSPAFLHQPRESLAGS